jgi:hypothetical protein
MEGAGVAVIRRSCVRKLSTTGQVVGNRTFGGFFDIAVPIFRISAKGSYCCRRFCDSSKNLEAFFESLQQACNAIIHRSV